MHIAPHFRRLLLGLAALGIFGLTSLATYAQTAQSNPAWNDIKAHTTLLGCAFGNNGAPPDPRAVVAVVIKVFMGILGIIFLIYVLYAGYTWMTAAGDEDKVRQAKSTLVRGVIGMLIIFAAYSITRFVLAAAACAVDTYNTWCVFLQRF